jgi:hypothetical protein
MVTFTNDQYQCIFDYNNLLNSIEEGFSYVVESFTNLSMAEGERVFKDILASFFLVDSLHGTLQIIFTEDIKFIEAMMKFDQVILTLDGEAAIFPTVDLYRDFVKNHLFPAYLAWKEMIQYQLQPYISN